MPKGQVSDPYDDFITARNTARRGGAPCTLAASVASLPPERRAGLERALADESIPTKIICRVLANWGLDFLPGVIRRHRPWQAPGDRCVTCLG
jgi:hypothetical protein